MDMKEYFYQRDRIKRMNCKICGNDFDGLYVESEKKDGVIVDYHTPCRYCENREWQVQFNWRNHNLVKDNTRKKELSSMGMAYGSPENMRDITIDFLFENEKLYALSIDKYKNHILCGGNDNACFYGAAGTGKTMAAYAICNEMHFNLMYPKIITHPMLKKAILKSYDDRNNWQIVNHYANSDMLVIDEFGSFEQKENDRSWLFDILDLRYQKKLPTILIINTEAGNTILKLKDDLGYRLYDRMRRNMKMIEFEGNSFR